MVSVIDKNNWMLQTSFDSDILKTWILVFCIISVSKILFLSCFALLGEIEKMSPANRQYLNSAILLWQFINLGIEGLQISRSAVNILDGLT